MTHEITFAPGAAKEMSRLHPDMRERVSALAQNPYPSDSEVLRGNLRGVRRIRIGSHRLSYTVDNDSQVIRVLAVGPRGGFYERAKR